MLRLQGDEVCDTSDGFVEHVYSGSVNDDYFNPNDEPQSYVYFPEYILEGGPAAVSYGLVFIRYANGSSTAKPMNLELSNGDETHTVEFVFEPTGGWDVWQEERYQVEGGVTRYSKASLYTTSDAGSPNIDYLELGLSINCGAPGGCGYGGGTAPCTAAPNAAPQLCEVNYDITGSWGNTYQVNLTINNSSEAAIEGYDIGWDLGLGESFVSGWNADYTSNATRVTASNSASRWNGSIPVNGSISFGFQAQRTQPGNPTIP